MKKEKQKFDKVLSQFDILALAFGAMIGWGWVVLSGSWVSTAGLYGSIVAFMLGGIAVVFIGLVYSELTTAMPKVGGEHVFVERAMGMKWSFVASWAIALGYISVVAFEAVALPTVVEYLFPNYKVGFMWTVAGYDVYFSWVALGVAGAIILTLLNMFGVKTAATFQFICTILLVLVGLSLFSGSVVTEGATEPAPLFKDGWGGILTVLIMTPFMFVGFDVIPQAAEEINLPNKKIGQVLILSVVMAVVWYILMIYSVGQSLNEQQLSESSLATADAMGAIFNSSFASKILIIAGIGGILTSWNSFLIGGSRILYVMANSGMIPRWLGKMHPKYKTPANAILFIGTLSVIAPLFGKEMLVWLVDAGGLSIIVAYALVAVSFLILRKTEPGMERPFRAGNSSIVGWIAVLLSIGLAALYMPGMPSALIWPYEWILFGGWWVIGAYFLWKASKVKFIEGDYHLKQQAVDE
ncbi:APC family permease [Bacillus sp. FJAT-47783]|uniref:APC family permease n=1 Tax=Bacillus sp. FJAT-47783 TaxID=2922712 RepID=UPI001FAD8995|nr:APC family permease [Bacillus sp. FJAT-47783]